jgi:hypothetical protein
MRTTEKLYVRREPEDLSAERQKFNPVFEGAPHRRST